MIAIQLARLSGFAPIITTASLRNTQLLKDLGATHVLDRSLSSSALQATVQDIVKGPVRLVFDSISVLATQTAGYELLAPGGTIVLVRKIEVPPELITADKEIADILGVVHIPEKRAAGVSFFRNLPGLLESGDIKVSRTEKCTLNGLFTSFLCSRLLSKCSRAAWLLFPLALRGSKMER